ncbi:syntaxin, Qa-SNARE family [Hepatocystis sp. ex Piliocolobus tephrosceles]|nr:syntaxin, Qa-SNARE family [Hepatocystis sp. ex Piliocolobus tephrosceles]
MSYSNITKGTKKPQQYTESTDFELQSEIQKNVALIQSYTLRISKINNEETCSIESSKNVKEIVQKGKIKLQETQEKLKLFSMELENASPNEKTRMKLMFQKLSNSYLKSLNKFQIVSEEYIGKTEQTDMKLSNMELGGNLEYTPSNSFSRNSSTRYDSNNDNLNVNIYDYNFYEQDNYNDGFNKNEKNDISDIESGLLHKKYKKNIFAGNKTDDINEYLLQNDEINEHGDINSQEKQFVSVKTYDIENEILTQKNNEIKKLHKEIVNIQGLYKDLFDQVNIQGESIDIIDSQIITTHDSIHRAGREIEITRSRYFRNIKCTICLIIFLIFLIIFILVVFKVI